ncbi:MAG: porin family protein [Cellvibrionaceae bacterium]|nr:porin family protein [Cellvibrionaceae bacterium]
MFNKILLTLLLLNLPIVSSAQWVGGTQIFQLNSEDGDFETDVQGLALSLGHTLLLTSKIAVVPELRLGRGLKSETVAITGTDLKIELNRLFSLAARIQYKLTEKLQLFAMPTYTNTEFTVSTALVGENLSETADDWDLGIGLGTSYTLHKRVSGDLMFEYYDGKTALSLGARWAL